jgi:hypothetical protein
MTQSGKARYHVLGVLACPSRGPSLGHSSYPTANFINELYLYFYTRATYVYCSRPVADKGFASPLDSAWLPRAHYLIDVLRNIFHTIAVRHDNAPGGLEYSAFHNRDGQLQEQLEMRVSRTCLPGTGDQALQTLLLR